MEDHAEDHTKAHVCTVLKEFILAHTIVCIIFVMVVNKEQCSAAHRLFILQFCIRLSIRKGHVAGQQQHHCKALRTHWGLRHFPQEASRGGLTPSPQVLLPE